MPVTKTDDGKYRIEVDIWGHGYFDLICEFEPLSTQARIYSALASFFDNSQVRIHSLTNLKRIKIDGASKRLREAREPKIQKTFEHAQKILENALEQTLSKAVREFVYSLIERTVKELKNEVSVSPVSQVERRLKSVEVKFKKRDRKNLELPKLGRKPGSKKHEKKYSNKELYKALRAYIHRCDLSGERITKDNAAKALRLGYAKKLQRLLDDFGEERNWRDLVESIRTETK
jgi:hypothetical protein